MRARPGRRLSLEDAGRLAGLSPGYFRRLFAQEMGVSFRSFVLHTRLERALLLLQESEMSVGEIALSLGYQDVFLFSRQFKARYGQAPSRVRDAQAGS